MTRWSQQLVMGFGLLVLLGHAPAVWAACSQVATTDFLGTVCSDPGLESRSGRWILSSGGMLDGTARSITNPDGSAYVTKSGKVKTPGFDGDLYRTESKSTTGQVASSEMLSGTWILAPDEKLTGTWRMIQNPDGTISITDARIRLP